MLQEVIDRSKKPEFKEVAHLDIKEAKKLSLRNGIDVYVIDQGTQEVCSIDLIFKAGKWVEPQKLVSRFTHRLMREGTSQYTSSVIAEKLDFFGASLKSHSDGDITSVTLFALNKNLPLVLPVFEDIIKHPAFPEKELDLVLTNAKEKYKVRSTKNEFIADRELVSSLFGADHPYGYTYDEKDFNQITAKRLRQFKDQFLHSSNCFIILAGRVDDTIIRLVDKHFGGKDWLGQVMPEKDILLNPAQDHKFHKKVEGAFQSAIRIGKPLFNKTHPDFPKLYVLNTILGGYFGSRLMTNIREDKGFTYGIHSGLSSEMNGGYFYVSTEVGVAFSEQTLKEIYYEISRLKEEDISPEEISLVRNYMSGKLLSGLDGPFKQANMLKGLIIYDLNIEYIYNLLETIKTVSPAELKALAQKYFDLSDFYEIVIG